jgi:hypothetical protein
MLLAGTSFVTTLPAPTIAFSPIVTLDKMVQPDPIDAPLPDVRLLHFPVGFCLELVFQWLLAERNR